MASFILWTVPRARRIPFLGPKLAPESHELVPHPRLSNSSSEPSGHPARSLPCFFFAPHRLAARQVTSLPESPKVPHGPQNKIQTSNHKAHLMAALLPSSLPTSLVCSVPQAWQAPSLYSLFIYLWLPWVFVAVQGFSSYGEWGLLSSCSAGLLIAVASLRSGARALGRAGSVVVVLGLSCPLIFPRAGIELVSPALARWSTFTGDPTKEVCILFS